MRVCGNEHERVIDFQEILMVRNGYRLIFNPSGAWPGKSALSAFQKPGQTGTGVFLRLRRTSHPWWWLPRPGCPDAS